MLNAIQLTPQFCEIFDLPYFQFSQLKQYQPENILQIKADYKANWQQWRILIEQVSDSLGSLYAPRHIERWCNGWQVRAHFFAFFKYQQFIDSAPILSIILNQKRLTVSLEWHTYKAMQSHSTLKQYHNWLNELDTEKFADWQMWRESDGEYADYRTVSQVMANEVMILKGDDFWCIGKSIERADLAKVATHDWLVQTIEDLSLLYEACFNE